MISSMEIIIRRRHWTIVVKESGSGYRAFARTSGVKKDRDLRIHGDAALEVLMRAQDFIDGISLMEPL
jgi:hypothetical protein